MLRDLKLRVCSAVILASASFGQSGEWGCEAFVAVALTLLRASAPAIRRSLPVSLPASWRDSASILRAHPFLRAHPLPGAAPLNATLDSGENRYAQS